MAIKRVRLAEPNPVLAWAETPQGKAAIEPLAALSADERVYAIASAYKKAIRRS